MTALVVTGMVWTMAAARFQDADLLFRAVRAWARSEALKLKPRWTPSELRHLRSLARPMRQEWTAEELTLVQQARKALEAMKSYDGGRRWTFTAAIRLESNELLRSLQSHETWLESLNPGKRGRPGWAALTTFVVEVANPMRQTDGGYRLTDGACWSWGEREPTVDDVVALSILAGLLQRDDLVSIVNQASQGKREWPTLSNGIDVQRGRVRKAILRLTGQTRHK